MIPDFYSWTIIYNEEGCHGGEIQPAAANDL